MSAQANAANLTQQTINIQNLYQMYQANPHSANDKYSALDNIQMGSAKPQQQPFAASQPSEQKQFVPSPSYGMPQAQP